MSVSMGHLERVSGQGLPVRGASLRLAPELVAPREGRRLVRHLLRWAPTDAVDRIELLVSELVTNSIVHGGLRGDECIDVSLRFASAGVRVEVSDPGGQFQPTARPPPDGHTRWGLYLVDRVADRWGMDRRDDGKALWFEVDL